MDTMAFYQFHKSDEPSVELLWRIWLHSSERNQHVQSISTYIWPDVNWQSTRIYIQIAWICFETSKPIKIQYFHLDLLYLRTYRNNDVKYNNKVWKYSDNLAQLRISIWILMVMTSRQFNQFNCSLNKLISAKTSMSSSFVRDKSSHFPRSNMVWINYHNICIWHTAELFAIVRTLLPIYCCYRNIIWLIDFKQIGPPPLVPLALMQRQNLAVIKAIRSITSNFDTLLWSNHFGLWYLASFLF